MSEPVLDLFGEVRITTQDVDAWLRAVPRLQPGTPRAARYVKNWNVIDKIRRAKLDGTFDATTAQRTAPAGVWWERFDWVLKEQSPHAAG